MITNFRISVTTLTFCLLMMSNFPLIASDVKTISWNDLLPPGWNPAKVFEDMSDEEFNAMSDEKYFEMQTKVQAEIDAAPVVEHFNGQTVRIPGFIVPLEIDNTSLREFFLVPYFGACTHTPPPPANQIIYSEMKDEYQPENIFQPVWITGKLKTGRFQSQLSEAGVAQAANIDSAYSVSVDLIEPY
ncbi:MAG: DUF3299 domain-containing protein [Gammaproteobacteria bacterium]|nr:DUF3299 domain-containing protein [Gammaproteobacteria bacterium]